MILETNLIPIADISLGLVILRKTYKIIDIKIFVLLLLLKLIALVINYKKTFIPHTFLNKITGFLIFLFVYIKSKYFLRVIYFFSLLASIHDLYLGISIIFTKKFTKKTKYDKI